MSDLFAQAPAYAPEACLAAMLVLLSALYWRDRVRRSLAERSLAELTAANEAMQNHAADVERSLDHIKARLLMGVAARIGQPIATIGAKARMLKRSADANPDVDAEFAAEIIEETAKLEGLVEDLLELSKLECGAIEWKSERVETESLMGRAIASADAAALRRGIRLESEIEAPKLAVSGSEERLAQVLGHLLDNAIKFSPRGAVVTARAFLEDDEVVFSVKDLGQGMAEEELDRLLENLGTIGAAFSEAPGSLGLGVGLSLCREIVKRHGGRIWAETQAGEGSEFGFALSSTSAA